MIQIIKNSLFKTNILSEENSRNVYKHDQNLSALSVALPPAVERLMTYEQKFMSQSVDSATNMAITNAQLKYFAPESAKTFAIKSYWIAKNKMKVFVVQKYFSNFGVEFERINESGETEVLMLVHPES